MTDQHAAQFGSGGETVRVLLYSHDSFGLGHLRRCREIAHTFVRADADVYVLIISGSSVIGSFEFLDRIDFVRVPGVSKLPTGEYVSQDLPLSIEDTIFIRAVLIRQTVDSFRPDLAIVDKEPLGLCGELKDTLRLLQARGVPCVLGLRDVLDDPAALAHEWQRNHAVPALTEYYQEIWVYGVREIFDPLTSIALPPGVRERMVYTGYLRRIRSAAVRRLPLAKIHRPYLLVTIGGGGDGEAVINWVLRAYETGVQLPYPALIVLGPFMNVATRQDFERRAARLADVETLTFDANIESLIDDAVGMVSMCGFNTFCEILSFDKRALVVPRSVPRREQYLRAERADALGLVRMLPDDGRHEAGAMVAALRALPAQEPPSATRVDGLLDGCDRLAELGRLWFGRCRDGSVVTPMRSCTRRDERVIASS